MCYSKTSLTAGKTEKKRSSGKVTLCTFENFDSRDLLTIPPRRLIFSRTSESEDYITHTVKEKKIIEFLRAVRSACNIDTRNLKNLLLFVPARYKEIFLSVSLSRTRCRGEDILPFFYFPDIELAVEQK